MQIQAPGSGPATQGDVELAAATALRAIAASSSGSSSVLSAALVRQVTWMTCLMFFAFELCHTKQEKQNHYNLTMVFRLVFRYDP